MAEQIALQLNELMAKYLMSKSIFGSIVVSAIIVYSFVHTHEPSPNVPENKLFLKVWDQQNCLQTTQKKVMKNEFTSVHL